MNKYFGFTANRMHNVAAIVNALREPGSGIQSVEVISVVSQSGMHSLQALIYVESILPEYRLQEVFEKTWGRMEFHS